MAGQFLGFSALEGVAFRERHPMSAVLMGSKATREGFLRGVRRAPGICRVSSHMSADPKDPLKSSLGLHDGTLELRDIYNRMRMDGTWLTILNGCESGVLGKASAGNPEGLPLGFLFAGSTTVVSTLWKVDDLPSALLMDRFHLELSREGVSVSMALQRAANWLRGHRPTSDSEALGNGVEAASAIRELSARVRRFRGKPRLRKPWREILAYCEREARECEGRFPDRPPFSHPLYWAGHVAMGAAWLMPRAGQPASVRRSRKSTR